MRYRTAHGPLRFPGQRSRTFHDEFLLERIKFVFMFLICARTRTGTRIYYGGHIIDGNVYTRILHARSRSIIRTHNTYVQCSVCATKTRQIHSGRDLRCLKNTFRSKSPIKGAGCSFCIVDCARQLISLPPRACDPAK